MRQVLALLLLLHCAAHFGGVIALWSADSLPRTVAGFLPSAPNLGGRFELGPIALRLLGLGWLALGVGFGATAVGVLRASWWWLAALVGFGALSLIATLVWWPATRLGVTVNVALLGGMVAVGIREYRGDMERAAARVAASSMIETAAGPIEYATAGEGTPVLAIHGTAGGWDQALMSAAGLAEYGYRVIAPSRFGYLRTPPRADASPALEADTWVTLLDSLGVERVAVLSWSAGAAAAVQLALRHPERVSRLVFFVPGAGGIVPPAGNPPMWLVDAVFRWNFPIWAAQRLMPRLMLSWVAVPASLVPTLGPADREALESAIDILFPVSDRHDGMLYDARSQGGAFGTFSIDRIAAPTLWISAEDDLYGTLRVARHAAGAIPGARLLSYRTGGHLLLGRSRDFWPQIDRFIRDSR